MLHRSLSIVIAVLLAIDLVICVVIGGCDMPIPTMSGSVPMKCHWGFIAVSIVLAAGLVLAIFSTFLRSPEARRFAGLTLGIIALTVAFIPSEWAVGTCSWEGDAMCCANSAASGASAEELAACALSMDCHVSAIATWITAALVLVVAVILVVKAGNGSSLPRHPRLRDGSFTNESD